MKSSNRHGQDPEVTVLMPVYNSERHLREAVESILSQTFTDFEFLIVDDGSADRSIEIVESYDDPRIVLIKNTTNRGTVHVLNQGINAAKGRYIARMDSDDISLPHRLEKQVRFMEANPAVGISGSAMRLIKGGKLSNTRTLAESDSELKIALLFSTCFFHPTVIIRTELAKAHPYPDNLVYTQDYNYWTDLAGLTRFANLDETLLYFREHEGQLSCRKADLQVSNARLIRNAYLQRLFGSFASKELDMHHRIAENRSDIDLAGVHSWLERLISLNAATGTFPQETFEREMAKKWWYCCRKHTRNGRKTLQLYRESPLHRLFRPGIWNYCKFWIRCLAIND